MGKISPVSAKYIVHSTIQIEGTVDRPDVIGAIFGQTEGLLGSDLELRELQRSGRIGRIEVNIDTKGGKSQGSIIIPSSLDKAETCIVGAALEIIQRIGPCNARVRVEKIEDVRISKRNFVIDRAKELLRNLTDSVLPDSQEIADEVAASVRVMEIQEYGKDRLPAGPSIDDSEEVIVVEGRADVLNMLKQGIKNVIAINGTSIPQTIIELAEKKVLTAFVDGDRGGDLILREMLEVAEIDYVTKAPDGKEVEEITKKEIHKALRSRISAEQAKLELGKLDIKKPTYGNKALPPKKMPQQQQALPATPVVGSAQPAVLAKRPMKISDSERDTFSRMLEDLIGTRGAYLLDEKLNILGKVPSTEITPTLKSMGKVHAVVFDGDITQDVVDVAEEGNVKYLVAMSSKVRGANAVTILTVDDL